MSWLSVLRVGVGSVGDLPASGVAAFEVHLVWLWSKHIVKVTRVHLDLLVEPLSVAHLNGPTFVEATHEMTALDMVDSVLFPASVQFVSEDGGLF